MPLGVLAVDVDRLLTNRLRGFGSDSPYSTPRSNEPVDPSTPSSFRRPVPRASPDCYLIKSSGEHTMLRGAIVQTTSSNGGKEPTSPSRTTPKRRRKKRVTAAGGDSQQAKLPADDKTTCEPAFVSIKWNPMESYGHTVLVPKLSTTSATSSWAPHESPTSHPQNNAVISSEDASVMGSDGSRPTTAGQHGGRLNSARIVRVVVPGDPHPGTEEQNRPSSVRGQLTSPSTAMLPLFHPARDRTAPVALSTTAKTVMEGAIDLVKTRLQQMVDPTMRRSRQPASARSSTDVLVQRLSDDVIPARREVCSHQMKHRVPAAEVMDTLQRIEASASHAPARVHQLVQERLRQSSVAELRRESLLSPRRRGVGGTLSSFRASLQSKRDPTFEDVFVVEYVKPPRTAAPVTRFRDVARRGRRVEDNDGLTTDEARLYHTVIQPAMLNGCE